MWDDDLVFSWIWNARDNSKSERKGFILLKMGIIRIMIQEYRF